MMLHMKIIIMIQLYILPYYAYICIHPLRMVHLLARSNLAVYLSVDPSDRLEPSRSSSKLGKLEVPRCETCTKT